MILAKKEGPSSLVGDIELHSTQSNQERDIEPQMVNTFFNESCSMGL